MTVADSITVAHKSKPPVPEKHWRLSGFTTGSEVRSKLGNPSLDPIKRTLSRNARGAS